jgi:hypothetical protein
MVSVSFMYPLGFIFHSSFASFALFAVKSGSLNAERRPLTASLYNRPFVVHLLGSDE